MTNSLLSPVGKPSLQVQAQAALELRKRRRERAARYRNDPVLYAAERLGVQWWHKQAEIAQALVNHERVLVKSGHTVGKTMLAGGLVLWWYETRDPGITLTTAPTRHSVEDLLWREARAQAPSGIPFLPKAPQIEGGGFHYAQGYVAENATAFQGRHEENLLVIFDEAVGIGPDFWLAASNMAVGPDCRHIAFCNPTDTTSEAYSADQSGRWHTVTISALDHPNIAAELVGVPVPYPSAVRLSYIEDKLHAWCTPVFPGQQSALDIEFPPDSGQYWTPGPLFESRVMGRWPSQALDNIWSDALLAVAFRENRAPLKEPTDWPCQIGCDVARFGDDMTVMHVRRGPVSLHHESHNGWSTTQTAGRLKELAREWGRSCGVDGRAIAIVIDDDGVGGGVTDQAGSYAFIPAKAGGKAYEPELYPNRRSEAWFSTAARAREGRLDLSRLPADVQHELARQLRAPKWKLDSQGRRVVEAKDITKKRIGRSPDDADAINLAYAPADVGGIVMEGADDDDLPGIAVPQTESVRRPIEKTDRRLLGEDDADNDFDWEADDEEVDQTEDLDEPTHTVSDPQARRAPSRRVGPPAQPPVPARTPLPSDFATQLTAATLDD